MESNFAFFAGVEKTDTADNSLWEMIDKVSGLKFVYETDTPSVLWCMPIETVSLSEGGFERTLQGCCVVRLWKLELGPKESKNIALGFNWIES